jgi:hypothetical protein
MKAMATLLGIGAIVVGCTVNSTTNNGGDSCSTSSSVTCEGAATGYSCTGTSVPSDSDATLDCSYGTADNGNTDYCCISLSSSVTCSQDTTVTGWYPFTRSLADRGIALCGSILRVMTRIRCPLA